MKAQKGYSYLFSLLIFLVFFQQGFSLWPQTIEEPDGKILVGLTLYGSNIEITLATIVHGIQPVFIGGGNSNYIIYGPNNEELFSGEIHLPIHSVYEWTDTRGNLHDEYLFEKYPFMPDSTTYTGDESNRANVAIETDPTKVKWSTFITGSPPVPTPFYYDGYGIFEGAGKYNKGIFRPTPVSMMRNVTAPFFAVNSRQLASVLRQFR